MLQNQAVNIGRPHVYKWGGLYADVNMNTAGLEVSHPSLPATTD